MKVPKATKEKSGLYRIQLRLGGKSVVVHGNTEKACIRAAQLAKSEHLTGKRISNVTDITLADAIDAYIEKRSNVLSPSTIRGYKIIKRNRFKSAMDRPAKSITRWQAIVNDEAELCSAKTLRNAWLFVASVLHDNNLPVPEVRLPQVAPSQRPFLEPDEIPVLLKAVRGQPCEMAVLLALHSLRRSEILALKKSDIDITANTISVHGAVVPNEDNELVEKATNKNTSSTRTVPIFIPRLAEIAVDAPDGPLVTMHPDTMRKHINRLCKANSLPPVGIHGLRHSFASLAYHLGLPQRQTMEIGGWSNPNTMDKIYTHLAQKDRAKAKNALTAFYEKM